MRIRTGPDWAMDPTIWQFFGTWRSTQCSAIRPKAPCAESSSEPAGTTHISPAFWPYFEVRLPWPVRGGHPYYPCPACQLCPTMRPITIGSLRMQPVYPVPTLDHVVV